MKQLSLLVLFFVESLFASPVTVNEKGERHIVVITASYNNVRYFLNNLGTVFEQKYENYHIIYVNDYSQDDTQYLVPEYVARRGMQDKLLYISNSDRRYALANQYQAAHLCKPTDIIVMLDGDDWLASDNVFSYLNKAYSDSNIWTTYGHCRVYPSYELLHWAKALPENVIKENSIRSYDSVPTHLRTFYAQLFHNINRQDLLYENDFFHMTGDMAFLIPIYEMAGLHHKFIETVLMIYNSDNPLNDHKVSKELQINMDQVIRKRAPYNQLQSLFEEER